MFSKIKFKSIVSENSQKGLIKTKIETIYTCLRRTIFFGFESIFMHDPVRFLAIGCSSSIKHQCFPHPYEFGFIVHCFVSSSSLPKPCQGCPICSRPCRILLIFMAEEIPLVLFFISDPAFICSFQLPLI